MLHLNIIHKVHNVMSFKSSQDNFQQFGTELAHIVAATVINAIIEPLVKNIVDWFTRLKKYSKANSALKKSHNLLLEYAAIYLSQDISQSFNNILSQMKGMLDILVGSPVIERSLGCFFIGPPGTGKTSLLKRMYRTILETCAENGKKSISIELSDEERKDIFAMRKKLHEGNLVIGMMFSGSFFDKFGKDKLQVFDSFIKDVQDKLKAGHIVFIGIDEIDALIYSKKGNLRAEFLVRLDELYNGMRKNKSKGLLFIACTTNGGDFDEAMVRRISREIIVFNYPDPSQQFIIFSKKLVHYKEKFKTTVKKMYISRLDFNFDKIVNNLKGNLFKFSRNGIDFSGAEAENIILNFYSTLTNLPEEDLKIYGANIDEQANNLFLFYLLKETWKILKIRQGKFAAEIKESLEKIIASIKYPASCPKIEAGCDWMVE